jgi:predicted phage tail protein
MIGGIGLGWGIWLLAGANFVRLVHRDWHDPAEDRQVVIGAALIVAAFMAAAAIALAALS